MRTTALVLGIVGGLVGLMLSSVMITIGSQIMSYGSNWGGGYAPNTFTGLAITWGSGALLGLFGLFGLLGGVLSPFRPGVGRRLMLLAALVILLMAAGVAGLVLLAEPQGSRFAVGVAIPLVGPAAALFLGGLLCRKPAARSQG